MKQFRRWQRILILSLLFVSVFAPILFVSSRLKGLSLIGGDQFIEDLASIKYRTDELQLSAIEQEAGEELKEPKLVVFEDKDFSSVVSYSSTNVTHESEQSGNTGDTFNGLERNVSETNHDRKPEQINQKTTELSSSEELQGQSNKKTIRHKQHVASQSQTKTDEKMKLIKDQLIRAKAYLYYAPPGSHSHLVKDLRTRMRDLEKAVGQASKDSELSKSALQRMKGIEITLSKASQVFPDCPAMASKLRAMTYNAEEQIRAQKNQEAFLLQLAGRTTPKGLHCLSMRLTAEYFSLQPEERQLPNQQKLNDRDLYHYAVFSDNVLACAVVVNSTVSSAMQPEKIVFHVVTNSLNLPAMSMWFLLNPPGKVTIGIQSMENFEWLSSKYNSMLKEQKARDPRYTSPLNHLRFYLPDIFPALNKIVLFDHDVVVQQDLTSLWNIDMKGRVNGAVETCQEGEASFHRMHMFINFSDPYVAKRFDDNACTWAFGLNLFDLKEWRRQNITARYHKYLQLGYKRPLWKGGSLPLGWVTFYNKTVALDKRWHVLGLGYESGVKRGDIEQAAVVHYDGVMKPWLEIGIHQYKGYWSKHLKYDHLYLQQCNIHE